MNFKNPRILQLCKKFPYPAKDGESLAIISLAKSLHQLGGRLDLLAMNTTKHYTDYTASLEEMDFYGQIQVVKIDNRVRPLAAFANLWSSKSYHIDRFQSSAMEQKLQEMLVQNSYDIIQLETLYLSPYIPIIKKYSQAKILMRSHNVEHEIWERITQNTTNPIAKSYLAYLTRKLKRYEVQQLQHYDLLAAITQRDLDQFKRLGYQGNALNIPIGINSQDYPANWKSFDTISISFLGSLDWIPNVEGLKWFLKNCWGLIQTSYPTLELHVAGRNPSSELLHWQQKQVTIHGEIENAIDFINTHSIMVVPLQSGSGMRVKILEAMALGRVVITTTVGAEGIHAQHLEEIIIADSPEEFFNAIQFCMKHREKLKSIGQKAQRFIQTEFDATQIAKKLLNGIQ